ncbi:MAG: 5-hydroxyisourate hydrolase-like protein (transthyretin family) [Planctomycetota bacterium]|jgi:5-hydroxyisourate hydrolase-like protein (transthyretin family)
MASFFVKDERWLLLRTENADSANESVRKPITADQVLELQAVRSCSVTGRLLMFDGKPATYVEVALQRNRGDANRSRWGPVAFATTDGDGKFSCLGLSHTEKHLRLFVMSPAGSAAHPYVHTADVAGTIGLGDITLAQPAVVHGVVRRPDGTPAIGYSVTLREHQPKQKGDGYLRSAMTDSQGRYRFSCVPPCSANLVVMDDPGQPLQQHPVTLAPGEIHKLNLDVLGN